MYSEAMILDNVPPVKYASQHMLSHAWGGIFNFYIGWKVIDVRSCSSINKGKIITANKFSAKWPWPLIWEPEVEDDNECEIF